MGDQSARVAERGRSAYFLARIGQLIQMTEVTERSPVVAGQWRRWAAAGRCPDVDRSGTNECPILGQPDVSVSAVVVAREMVLQGQKRSVGGCAPVAVAFIDGAGSIARVNGAGGRGSKGLASPSLGPRLIIRQTIAAGMRTEGAHA